LNIPSTLQLLLNGDRKVLYPVIKGIIVQMWYILISTSIHDQSMHLDITRWGIRVTIDPVIASCVRIQQSDIGLIDYTILSLGKLYYNTVPDDHMSILVDMSSTRKPIIQSNRLFYKVVHLCIYNIITDTLYQDSTYWSKIIARSSGINVYESFILCNIIVHTCNRYINDPINR
jgi:hypothetical protein